MKHYRAAIILSGYYDQSEQEMISEERCYCPEISGVPQLVTAALTFLPNGAKWHQDTTWLAICIPTKLSISMDQKSSVSLLQRAGFRTVYCVGIPFRIKFR